jgi:5-methylcytosine-specific restriction enzyme A
MTLDTTRRYANRDRDFPRKDAAGNRVCRWCRKPLTKGRVYCSPQCLAEVDIRCGFAVRWFVNQRDHGICADCGISTEDLDDALHQLRWRIKESGNRNFAGEFRQIMRECGLGFEYKATECVHHVIPVKEGGGCCGLENLITLCIRCHKKRHASKGNAK